MTIKENYSAIANFLSANNAPADMIEFVNGRIAQEDKARENAKAKRLEKNGGEKKDPANSEFYTGLRESIYKVLTTEFQTGDALVTAANAVTTNGKPVLAAQVAMALKPLIEDGTVVTGQIKVAYVNGKGLNTESLRKAYKLA
jgi:hypothetical protein